MYHSLLTNRYLTSRVIPLIAVAAVALCVALVIIVVSVMTGFLDMVKSSGRKLMGDVVVSYPVAGLPYYERLIDHIDALPEAAAAAPVVDSWALLRMPYPMGPSKETQTVQVWGIEPASFARVTGYDTTLYWSPLDPDEADDVRPNDYRRRLGAEALARFEDHGRTLTSGRAQVPAMVTGMHVSIGNDRQRDGSYEPRPFLGGEWFMPDFEVTLTVVPIVDQGVIEPSSRTFQVVNEFISGVFLIDKTRIMIPLDVGQELLHLDRADRVDPDRPEIVIGEDPARATLVLIRAAEGVTPDELRDAVAGAYRDFQTEILLDDTALIKPPSPGFGLSIQTWEQQQREFIGPVEKERELMRTLFSLIYLVCAGLVLSIFWAIVYEKTREIGILRSIGASRVGISWIFLRYGLVIGALGAAGGLGLGTLVVHNINTIHNSMGDPPAWLAYFAYALAGLALIVTIIRSMSGRLLPLVLGSLVTLTLVGVGSVFLVIKYVIGGLVMWDPSVYYFTEIPNQVDYASAIVTMLAAVLFSLLGAFLPAAKAADTDPVKALRYE